MSTEQPQTAGQDGAANTADTPPTEDDRWASFGPEPERPPGRLRRALRPIGRQPPSKA